MHHLRRKVEEWSGPRWPRRVRMLIVLCLVSLGYVCYRFRLTSAAGFGAIGLGIAFVILVVKRTLWKRSLRQPKA